MHSSLKTAMLLAGCTWPSAALADPVGPAATVIVPDAAPALSLGTTTSTLGNVTTIDDGTVAGGNLFHSFATFDLANGDVARWVHSAGDPASIGNVINRITGGTPSSLFGKLDSTALPNADFYFINPAGIIFGGQGAQVDVPAAAYFSTASELHFANDDSLSVATPNGSTLSVAAPASFGFLGGEGSIEILNAGLGPDGSGQAFLPDQQQLHLSGSDIIVKGSTIDHTGLMLAASGSQAAEIPLAGSAIPLAGTVTIESSRLRAGWGEGPILDPIDGGPVAIAAGSLSMINSTISSFSALGGDPGKVDILLSDSLSLINSMVDEQAGFGSQTGGIEVRAASAQMSNSGIFTSVYFSEAELVGGDILVDIDSSLSMAGSAIASHRDGGGRAGNVQVLAGSLELIPVGGGIASTGSGDASSGDVTVLVDGTLTMGILTGISSATTVGSSNNARSGNVTIEASDLINAGGLIGTLNSESGPAGNIAIKVANLLLMDLGSIQAHSNYGAAGNIQIHAGQMQLLGGSNIFASTISNNEAGTLQIIVDGQLQLSNSTISTDTLTGKAGAIAIEAGSVSLESGSAILSRSNQSGDAGSISIGAADFTATNSFISSESSGSGQGGSIAIETTGKIDLTSTWVSTSALGSGEAGDIILAAGSVALDNASLSSFSTEGNAGFIVIDAQGHVSLNWSSLTTTAGLAGAIDAPGDAGTILILADTLTANDSSVSSESLGAGNGGAIDIQTAGSAEIIRSSFSTSAFGLGNAGGIFIRSGEVLIDASAIFSFAAGWGFSGLVSIYAGSATIKGGSEINTASYNSHPAGAIDIVADHLTVQDPVTNITSENFSVGPAGSIFLAAERIDLLDGARVSTSSALGPAGGIFLQMPPTGILVLASEDEPSTIETSSGQGTGGVIFISSPLAIISNGGSILALGESGGANVQIDTRYFISSVDRPNIVDVSGTLSFTNAIYDVSAGTVEAEPKVIDASAVLRGQCAAVRSSGAVSQLNVRPVGPFGQFQLRGQTVPEAGPPPGGCQ